MRVIVGICVVALILILGVSYVASPAGTTRFAAGLEDVFRIIRPIVVLGFFVAWFPLGRWLHGIGQLPGHRYALWRKVWAPGLIWYVLIEIGIGQGRPFIALGLTAFYGIARLVGPRLIPTVVAKENSVGGEKP